MIDQLPDGAGVTPLDDDDEDEFADHKPTLDDALRLWHQGLEWYKDDTVLGIREFAAHLASEDPEQRRVWIESVRHLEATGLVDADTATNLIHHIIEWWFEDGLHLEDPEQQRISEAMWALCDRHGLDGTDFTDHPNPPAEWTALVAAGEARDHEMRRAMYDEADEGERWRFREERPEDFAAVIARVDARLEADHHAARRKRYGAEYDEWGRHGLGSV